MLMKNFLIVWLATSCSLSFSQIGPAPLPNLSKDSTAPTIAATQLWISEKLRVVYLIHRRPRNLV
jgi:hypothetical protein